MIRKLFFLLFIIGFAISCTKEVPEREKKSGKSSEEAAVRKVIDDFFLAYNNGDVETAVVMLDQNYRGIVSDSIDVNGIDQAREDLLKYVRQYPNGKWQTNIEEITVGDNFAFVICSSSFMMPGPVENDLSPIYSERSIRVLRKDKIRGWTIFRYLATPTFTYDDK